MSRTTTTTGQERISLVLLAGDDDLADLLADIGHVLLEADRLADLATRANHPLKEADRRRLLQAALIRGALTDQEDVERILRGSPPGPAAARSLREALVGLGRAAQDVSARLNSEGEADAFGIDQDTARSIRAAIDGLGAALSRLIPPGPPS